MGRSSDVELVSCGREGFGNAAIVVDGGIRVFSSSSGIGFQPVNRETTGWKPIPHLQILNAAWKPIPPPQASKAFATARRLLGIQVLDVQIHWR